MTTDATTVDLQKLAAKVEALESTAVVKKTQRQTDTERVLEEIAKLGGKLTAEEDIVFSGKQLILPENMTLSEAIRFLREKESEDERHMQFDRNFKYRPWDGAHATEAALKKAFGAISQRSVQSFWGDQPPELKTINIGPNETIQVPWGRIGVVHLPGVDLYLGSERDPEYGIVFQIVATGPRKYRHHIEGIFKLVEEELKTNSIYRGKAFDGQRMPNFIDLSGINPEKVVYAEETLEQLEANIWSVLRWPEVLEELGQPLKRAVLLEGPYGTGKTMAAGLTAKIALENGWSYLLCRPGQDDLMEVMQTARLYQPAVVFFEDVDAISSAEHTIPRLLDIFDGIKAKGTRILCVLTTNHVEKIHKGMMRPGRLDSVIHIGALDSAGVRRLVEALVPEDLLDLAIDWEGLGKAFEGYMPAFAVGAIDRAVRHNVTRNQGKATELSTIDFVNSANAYRRQLDLMHEAQDKVDRPRLDRVLLDIVQDAVSDQMEGMVIKSKDNDDELPYILVGKDN